MNATMNAQDALMAMLPEHLLLGGMVVLIVMEVLGRGSRSALWVALGAVVVVAFSISAIAKSHVMNLLAGSHDVHIVQMRQKPNRNMRNN